MTMPRPKNFDPTEALDCALQVFWNRGYEATSLQELLDAMTLSKSSFYETFGSKHALYLAAIDRYRETALAQYVRILKDQDDGRQAIADVFEILIDQLDCPQGRRGCFMNNAAIESALHDAAAETRIREAQRTLEDAFYRAVRRAQTQGHIALEKDPRALARFLTSNMYGLLVMAKMAPGRDALQDVSRVALSALA
jgi:TetR/AcrR family transcriptional regulator, transcriptional repressor for nem operon